MEALIGVDVGTSSVKAAVFDLAGNVLAHAERVCGLSAPCPGWVEQSPDEVWAAIVSALRAATLDADTAVRPYALAMACQSGSVTPCRDDGTPVHANITWMDGRSEGIVDEWRASGIDRAWREIGGWMPHPGLALPTLAWLKRHRPDITAQAERYTSLNDWLVHRLTGRFCHNPSNAGGMQMLDVRTAQWSAGLCDLAGITPAQLSPVLSSGAAVGTILPDVAAATGLPRDLRVINGGHDQGCAALALGVTRAGRTLLACGTSWVITDVVEAPNPARVPDMMDLSFHAQPGLWTVSQSLGGLGGAMEWWVHQCWPQSSAQAREQRYAALNGEIAGVPPGGRGVLFLPISGGHRSPAGMQRGGFIGLRLDHTRPDMTRAIMESAAYELRWALGDIRAAGSNVDRLWMIGGATRSPHWPRIVADVTRLPLILARFPFWPALGAAILAGYGAGLFQTLDAAQRQLEPVVSHLEPDAATRDLYDEAYRRYRAACVTAVQR